MVVYEPNLVWVERLYLGITLQWRHNERDGVSNHQPHDCLLNCLFGCRSKKHQSSASLAFVQGIHRWPVNSRHKWPVTRKMFPFDNVIMSILSAITRDVRIVPYFQIWGYMLDVGHISCHHEMWPTSVSHSFSFLNRSLDFLGENITDQNILSLSLDLPAIFYSIQLNSTKLK